MTEVRITEIRYSYNDVVVFARETTPDNWVFIHRGRFLGKLNTGDPLKVNSVATQYVKDLAGIDD